MAIQSESTTSFDALLLAGGRSVRMGRDKAMLEWQGRRLWVRQVEKLLSLAPARLFVACRREQTLQEHNLLAGAVTWLHDPPGENLGPMAAIARAMARTELPLLVLAVDMPLITADFLRDQLLAKRQEGLGLFYQSGQDIEPLAGVYAPEMQALLVQAMERGELGLQKFIRKAAGHGLARIESLPPDAAGMMENANDPETWAQLQSQPGPPD